MSEESWYMAVLVLESSVEGETAYMPLIDLQYRLVRASQVDDAYHKAHEIGVSEEQSYSNADGEVVSWKFAGLHDLVEITDQELVHGTEVYSTILRNPPDDYVVPKDRLTQYFFEANKDKTAREIIEDD
jgi:hypothetical protein